MLRHVIAVSAVLAALPAEAAIIDLNTGTAAWQVVQNTGPAINGPAMGVSGPAVVLTGTLPFAANLPGFEAFAWVNPFGGAVWIGQLATDGQFSNGGSITCGSPCGAVGGTYTYSLSFDASMGGSMYINGFTADNGVRALSVTQANIGTLYSCTVAGPGPLCASTQNSITPATGLLALSAVPGGIVTISALVENLDGPGRNPSGFILSGVAEVFNRSIVPEPASWAMLITGFGLVGAVMRRRAAAAA